MQQSSFPKVSATTQQRREYIIQAATRVIAEQGLAALSVRSVATEAGCSRGLVEHYFRNKATLLVASNDWANRVYLERVQAAAGTLTGLAALEIRLRNLLPYNSTIHDEWKVRVAFWHQGITLPLVEQSNNQSFYAVYSALLADLQQAHEAGEICAKIPVIETSELLLMTVIGLCTSCMNDAELRQAAPMDRRIAMIMGFLKTGDVSSLKVGDPKIDY